MLFPWKNFDFVDWSFWARRCSLLFFFRVVEVFLLVTERFEVFGVEMEEEV